MSESKDIQVRDKQEVAAPAEQTKPGPVFSPDVDIFENEKEIVLLADMPGVKADDLNIDLRDNTLSLIGEVSNDAGEVEEGIVIEYQTGRYARQFTLSEVINQENIDAKLEDGVLRLTLPKVEKATPRKITVKAA